MHNWDGSRAVVLGKKVFYYLYCVYGWIPVRWIHRHAVTVTTVQKNKPTLLCWITSQL
jgi:hypothetical protein